MADCNHPNLANCDLIRFALPSSLLCGNRLGDDRRPPNDVIAIAMTPRFFSGTTANVRLPRVSFLSCKQIASKESAERTFIFAARTSGQVTLCQKEVQHVVREENQDQEL